MRNPGTTTRPGIYELVYGAQLMHPSLSVFFSPDALADSESLADARRIVREERETVQQRLTAANHQAGIEQLSRFKETDESVKSASDAVRVRCDQALATLVCSFERQLAFMEQTRSAGIEEIRQELADLVTSGDNESVRARELRQRMTAVGRVNEKIMALLVSNESALDSLDALAREESGDRSLTVFDTALRGANAAAAKVQDASSEAL